MRCIYCDRLNPPCNFVPIGVSFPVLGRMKHGYVCHDCDKILRSPERGSFMERLSYAMRDSSDT